MDTFKQIQADLAETIANNSLDSLGDLKGSTILVTGGTGFMGTWLAALVAHLNSEHGFGIQLHLLSRQKNLSPIIDFLRHMDKNIVLLKKDILSAIELPRETNYVIHAAANPNPAYHASKPIETMTTIVEGTLNLMRAIETLSFLRKVINISSGFLYNARNAQQPIDESHELHGDLQYSGAYLRAKSFSEYLLRQYQAQYKYPICHVRPFAFIGPFQALDNPWAHVSFLKDIRSNRNIRILGDGKAIRSYLYGSDLAYVLLSGLCHFEAGGVYNVGHPTGVSLRELAAALISVSGKKLMVQSGLLPYNDANSYFVPDVGQVISLLKFNALPLELSLKKTVMWSLSS